MRIKIWFYKAPTGSVLPHDGQTQNKVRTDKRTYALQHLLV
jgi:hypothetical protein